MSYTPFNTIGPQRRAVINQGCEFGVSVLSTPLDHVHTGVGAAALVAEDGASELPPRFCVYTVYSVCRLILDISTPHATVTIVRSICL